MASRINADSSNGLQLVSDSSGEVQFQSNGITQFTVNSSGATGTGLGKVLQVVTNRTDAKTVYSGSNNYSITELSTTITPTSASSLIIVDIHLSYETNTTQTFKSTKDGSVMTASGYEGYNNLAGNQRWSGLADPAYDVDSNSTMSHINIRFFDASGSTTSRTYGLDIRTSDPNNKTFYLNRCIGNAGADDYENGVSFVTIMEIAQ